MSEPKPEWVPYRHDEDLIAPCGHRGFRPALDNSIHCATDLLTADGLMVRCDGKAPKSPGPVPGPEADDEPDEYGFLPNCPRGHRRPAWWAGKDFPNDCVDCLDIEEATAS